MTRRVLVFGPAYLDRVLRVDAPLLHPGNHDPIDLSVGAVSMQRGPGEGGIALFDPDGGALLISSPEGWPEDGATVVHLDRPLDPGSDGWRRRIRGIDWLDDLGGMGAGFASALGGELVCAVGEQGDPMSDRVLKMLRDQGIPHHPTRVPGTSADWTLLVTSGSHGDKLPIGFRGCHARLDSYPGPTGPRVDVFVAASLTNPLIASALETVDAAVRVFAPTLRNMTDTAVPVSRFADRIDLLCCNRREWESLPDRDTVASLVPLVSITDGPEGAVVRYRSPFGESREHVEPAFPRSRPPVDTNRAGECFASTLLSALIDAGWNSGPVDDSLIQRSCRRASAAAALVLDLEHFGFPTPEEVDRALERGEVG